MYYKDNSTANGWFPRPVMPAQCKQWKKSFIADGENQGVATQVQANACNEKGNRQAWHYEVTFAGGEEKSFLLPCVSLPLNISRESVLERLRYIPLQPFHESFFETKDDILDKIKSLMEHRLMPEKIVEWEELFYDLFPQSVLEGLDSNQQECELIQVALKYGGLPRTSKQEMEPAGKSFFVDSMTFKGRLNL